MAGLAVYSAIISMDRGWGSSPEMGIISKNPQFLAVLCGFWLVTLRLRIGTQNGTREPQNVHAARLDRTTKQRGV